MQKWEYKIVYGPDETEVNKLGEQGWELVGFDPSFHAYFKRPKS